MARPQQLREGLWNTKLNVCNPKIATGFSLQQVLKRSKNNHVCASIDGIESILGLGVPMTTLTVRNIEPAIKDKLRMAAAANGRSMEEEVRSILRVALSKPMTPSGFGSRVHNRFRALGGVDLAPSDRGEIAKPASFDTPRVP
jgi:antitoxin FitA